MARGVPDANGNEVLSSFRGSSVLYCQNAKKRQRSARMTADQMAFPEFQFQRAAARLDAATETTIREIHLMSAIHKILWNRMNLWNRVIHERPGVARGHRMIHQMIRRLTR